MFIKSPPILSSKYPQNIGFFLLFLAGLADGVMVPFFPLWAHPMAGIPISVIGLLFGCYAGGELLATPIIGGIADRMGRRPVLIVSATGVGIGFIALFFTHGVIPAAIVLVIIGIFESVLHPTIYTLIADVNSISDQHQGFSKARVYANAGGIVGPLLGALVAQDKLSYVFVVSGFAMLIGGIVVMLSLPETRLIHDEGLDEEEEGFTALFPAFSDRRLAMLLIFTMILGITGSWVEAVLPLYSHIHLGLNNKDIGLLFTLGAVLNTLGKMRVTKYFTRSSPFLIVLGSGIALIISFGMLLVSFKIFSVIAAVCFYSLFQMMLGPLMPSVVNELAPLKLRATYMAALSVVSDLRDSIGPATGTALFAYSFTLPWLIGIPLVAIAILGLSIPLSSSNKSSKKISKDES
ncbi:MFS transporter [Pantoea endophytica]